MMPGWKYFARYMSILIHLPEIVNRKLMPEAKYYLAVAIIYGKIE